MVRMAPAHETVLVDYAAQRLRAQIMARAMVPPEKRPGSVLEWSFRHRRIHGHEFSLRRFPPLEGIYQDDHPHIAIIKPAQRGVSEYAINFACFALEEGTRKWAPDQDGLNVAYILPTLGALSDFSKERLSGLKEESEHLRRMFGQGQFDAVTFKKVGASYLYLRGGWSEAALLTFPADVLILDEYDKIAPRAVQLARRRLNASEIKREIDISTPTIPGRGIHALYRQSDRRVYEQPCPHCGEWVRYDFLRDVRVDGETFDDVALADGSKQRGWKRLDAEQVRRAAVALTCPNCRLGVDDAARCAPGRWRAEEPDVVGVRGYWIPPLAFPFVDLTTLAVAAVDPEPTTQTEFFRSDLGVPFDTAGSRITEAMLAGLAAQLPGGQLPSGVEWRETTMGVDVGARFNVRITSRGPSLGGVDLYCRLKTTVGAWSDLDDLLRRYQVRRCVVDAMPELHGAQEFAKRHPGVVMRAFYPKMVDADLFRTAASEAAKSEREGLRELGVDRGAAADEIPDDVVNINRTLAMDTVYASIAEARQHWPAAIASDRQVVAQMTSPTRVVSEDKRGQPRAEWEHAAPDHDFHADVYDMVARRLLPAPDPLGSAAIISSGVKGWNPTV